MQIVRRTTRETQTKPHPDKMNCSKNSLAQAIKRLSPGITRKALFALIKVPACRQASARYWEESYNILPWNNRKESEQTAALESAKALLAA